MSNENNMVSMKVDDDVVKAVIEKQIQAGIVMQLGNQEDLIAKAVTKALSVKSRSDGTFGRYESDNKFDFLEVLTTNAIRKAATEAMHEWVKVNSEKIKAAVLKELKKPTRQKSLAVAFANCVEDSLKCRWNMKCDVSFEEKSD